LHIAGLFHFFSASAYIARKKTACICHVLAVRLSRLRS